MGRKDRPYHARSAEDVLEDLEVDAGQGLMGRQVRSRREKYGSNRLRKARTRPWWQILLDQFKSIVIYLLIAAGVLAFSTGRWPEGVAILGVILVNTAIGFFSEWQAIRSMEALRRTGREKVEVRRDGQRREVNAEELVPGDIVLLKAGNLVPADLRLIKTDHLRVNEAALTGESVPVDKTTDPVDTEATIADRLDMLFKGTDITDGSAEAVTVATGKNTELGRISELAQEAEASATPLEERLNRLGRRLAWITIAIAIVVAGAGLLAGQPTMLMIETAIALGVAAIPEGLPIVATIALARGMYLMAQRHALINRLTAVETLGATRVIFTDKTGTLTENRMTLRKVVTPAGSKEFEDEREGDETEDLKEGSLVHRVLQVGVLCNSASLEGEEGEPTGDPTEIALLDAGRKVGLSRDELLEDHPEVREEPFDPDVKMMATFHESNGGFEIAIKGAPGAVLKNCDTIACEEDEQSLDDQTRKEWLDRANDLASEGLRLLAMAERKVEDKEANPYQQLRFLGLVGLLDPPRSEVRRAIEACHKAGVRVIMVTGDQPETGRAIGESVGIGSGEKTTAMHGRDLPDPDDVAEQQRERVFDTDIFARVSPEQKLNLVRIYQDKGETVAMTGDGVNDAPALKKADIGVAMGKRGTEAAKQVADMVLTDDAFASIVAAIEQGRVIFRNIRKAVMFMLCTNVAEVLAVTIASLANSPLPLRPLQILYLNVLTDVFPALALGVGKGIGNVMRQPPRDPKEPVLTRYHWAEIGGWSLLLGSCVLGGLYIALLAMGLPEMTAVTVSFLTLAFAKLWFVFNLRDPESGILRNEITENPWVWGAIVFCIGLLIAAVYMPGLSDVLQTRPLGLTGWALVMGMSLIPLIVGQIYRSLQKHPASSGSEHQQAE